MGQAALSGTRYPSIERRPLLLSTLLVRVSVQTFPASCFAKFAFSPSPYISSHFLICNGGAALNASLVRDAGGFGFEFSRNARSRLFNSSLISETGRALLWSLSFLTAFWLSFSICWSSR